MDKQVNLNADMGESYGRYTLGDDEGLIPYVKTVNIACGYHAADPGTMLAAVSLAKQYGREVGAHISYPDFMGFGRRRMELSEQEVYEISLYQIGALLGFCHAVGVRLNHVKPHGQLFLTGVHDRPTARGITRAINNIDKELMLIMSGPVVREECDRLGIRLVNEAFVDLDYHPDGSLILDRRRGARDPQRVADNAVSLVTRGGRTAIDGSWLPIPADSICLHGDMQNAVELAKAVNDALAQVQCEIIPLRPRST